MADETKIREGGGIQRNEPIQGRPVTRKTEKTTEPFRTEKTEISDEARILREFVPQVVSRIEKEREDEPKPAKNSEIARSLIEELVKTILAKKFLE